MAPQKKLQTAQKRAVSVNRKEVMIYFSRNSFQYSFRSGNFPFSETPTIDCKWLHTFHGFVQQTPDTTVASKKYRDTYSFRRCFCAELRFITREVELLVLFWSVKSLSPFSEEVSLSHPIRCVLFVQFNSGCYFTARQMEDEGIFASQGRCNFKNCGCGV